jgi:hypothetical protein
MIKYAGLNLLIPPVSEKQGPAALTNKKQGFVLKYAPITLFSGAGFAIIAINRYYKNIFSQG